MLQIITEYLVWSEWHLLHTPRLFQFLSDFEDPILGNPNVRWLPRSRIENPADYRFLILDYGSHRTFGFLKIEPSKSVISWNKQGQYLEQITAKILGTLDNTCSRAWILNSMGEFWTARAECILMRHARHEWNKLNRTGIPIRLLGRNVHKIQDWTMHFQNVYDERSQTELG